MKLCIWLVCALISVAPSVCAAQSATVSVTHNHPTGMVIPGDLVEIKVAVQTDAFLLFHSVLGDLRVSPSVGHASNNRFGHPNPSLTALSVIDPGIASGGGVDGVHINSGFTPLFTPPNPPPWGTGGPNELVLMKYDWIAPATPGTVRFDWSQTHGDPIFWVGFSTPALPTTYVGTTLTVTPTPATVALLAMVLGCAASRRR